MMTNEITMAVAMEHGASLSTGRHSFPPDNQSKMTPSTSNAFLQQEQCLQYVHKLFETSRWDDEESISCASLCGAHDKLLEFLQLEDEISIRKS